MRVTMNSLYDRINTDLSRLVENQAKTNAAISSGKIYRRPSDAPVNLTHALGYRSDLSDTKQFSRNIVFGQGWVQATETAMRQVQDRLTRAHELAIEGANDTLNATDRRAIADEVKVILEEVVSIANTSIGGRYILAGSRTKGYANGETPFMLDRDGKVTYNGNEEDFSIDTGTGQTQKINLDGKTALVQSGAFEALDMLQDALNANSQHSIETAIGDLQLSMNHVSQQTAKLGAMGNTLDKKEELSTSLSLTIEERLSDVEDTDIIRAISDLKTLDAGYQAALAAASKVMKMSLADFV